MTEFLDAFQGVTPARRGPGPLGKIILVILWLGVCVLPLALSVSAIQLTTGRIGTPGTLTVLSCQPLGQGRYDCKGSFLPDSGGPAVPVDASPDSDAGEVTRAQLTPAGDRAVPTGAKGLLAALALPAVGAGGLGFLPYVLLYWSGARRGRRTAIIVGSVLTAAGLLLAIVGMVAAA
ncbi:hypothetical protein Acor_68580 [Acrocarpospora corrugata]|uniref:Uncharacterized protein n=1 Tax=Acrocarpospora corrugata TaxID=35763 RepID=A0A5M3W989_9ACTN|nr:hypothetical protein [Acrocarpospora corrugata]GES04790.1 hypothetical protein Acor_68580 [Acrocarpospora corrugata]